LLSRAYVNSNDGDELWLFEEIHSVSINLNMSDVRKQEFQNATENDKILSSVIRYCEQGWPSHEYQVDQKAKFNFKLRNQLHCKDGLLFLNFRVVVPKNLQKQVLNKT